TRRMAQSNDRNVEYAKCAAYAGYFCHEYGVIDNAQGDTATLPFKLWPEQIKVMDLLQTERQRLILNARQLGISWLCCAYALWLCLFAPGKVVLFFSKGLTESTELLRRVKVLYERLPDWLKQAKLVKDNTEELTLSNGSRIQSLPATQSAG